MKYTRFALISLLFVALAFLTPAKAAIDLESIKPDGFAHGVVFTVAGYTNDTGTSRSTLTDFPVLVRISTTKISGFAYADSLVANGGDLRFKTADGTPLPFEVDTWDTSGESLVWVKLPSMTNGTEFAMFYGASANAAGAVATGNPWGDYTGVWHLNESGSGSAHTILPDSSGTGLGAVAQGTATSIDNGKLGRSWKINSKYDRVDTGIIVDASDSTKNAALNALGSTFHVSYWFKVYATGNSQRYCVMISRRGSGTDAGWGVQFSETWTKLRIYGNEGQKNAFAEIGQMTGASANTWAKLDVVWYVGANNKAYATTYFNGSQIGNGQIKKASNPTFEDDAVSQINGLNFVIGNFATTTSDRAIYGEMDEVRLKTGVPTADRVKADFDTVDNESFLSASAVSEFVVRPAPVVDAEVVDTGAAFLQFSGTITACGGSATAVDVYAKAWPTDSPPADPDADWTLLAEDVALDGTFGGILTGLEPKTAYTWAVKGVNNLSTPETSDLVTGTLETSGVGDAGDGGAAERQLDEFVHTFLIDERGHATFSFTPPAGVTEVDALVVAGGGPGGYYAGGGGGAGGLIYTNDLPVTPLTAYTITVGTGGVASASATAYGANGGNSSIVGAGVNLLANGGGAGGNGPKNNQTGTLAGCNGGSGGGATWLNYNPGSGTENQGKSGGTVPQEFLHAAGGGGASSVGGSVENISVGTSSQSDAPGGAGTSISISGSALYYAGGGGGGGEKSLVKGSYGSGGAGGAGGGGKGGQETDTTDTAIAENGVDGLGGGGGGGSTVSGKEKGGNGGNGVVIIRYGAGGDGDGVVHPTISLTGLTYDETSGDATVTYRVGWAGDGYDRADVSAIWGFHEDDLDNTNSVSTAPAIGQGTGSFQLPRVSKTVYVRLLATNTGNFVGVSPEIKSLVLFNPAAPAATVSASQTSVGGITDVSRANLEANVTTLGQGAESVNGVFQVCSDKFFDDGTYTTFAVTNGPITAAGVLRGEATGLIENTDYWIRAVLTNNIDQVYETDPVKLTTPLSDYPNASGVISVHGYTSVSALTKVTSKGLGSEETTRWLEVSQSDDFSTLVGTSTPIVSTEINVDETLTVTGLLPGTVYHVRIAISNSRNLTAYVPLANFTTRTEPFVASGPAWESGSGTFNFSLNVGGVYDGAACEAVLTYGGTEIGTKNFTEAGTVSWNGVTAAADGAIAQIVVTATLPNDGGTFTRTYESPVAAGSSGQVVSDVSTHFSAQNALWMKPGDVVDLPTPIGVASYQVLNERIAYLDGDNLIALEPGIVGLRCVDENYITNVMGIVILPDAIGSGSVYVFDETKHNSTYDWTRPECWKKVGSETNDSYPQNADDIAVLPFYTKAGDIYVRHRTDITLGGLYAGQIRPDTSMNCILERYADDDTKTITFRRADGETVDIKVCPNNDTGDNCSAIQFGGSYNINVTWVGDILIDGCSSETDINGPRGLVKYADEVVITNTANNAKITVQGLPGYSVANNKGTTKFNGTWKGTGEFVKKGQGSLVFPGDLSDFSGTVRELTGPNLGGFVLGAGGVLMRAAAASNVTASVYGFVAADNDGVPQFNGSGRGYFATGFSSVGPEGGRQAPGKGLYMHGGSYCSKMVSGDWGVGVADEKLLDVLSIGAGMGFLRMDTPDNSNGQPINAVTAKTLAQTDKGTFFFYDPSVNNPAATSVTNNMVTIKDWADHAVGGDGYGEAGIAGAANTFKIVPWFVSAGDGNHAYLMFPAVDSNGRLVRPVRTCTYIDEAGSEDANATCWIENDTGYGSLTHGTATSIVLNSLFLNNSTNGDKYLGADRTLTIKSGGLIFQGNGSAIGLPGRDDNGSLILGDADHPAYVWNKAFGDYTNQIWAAVTAPGGFVSTYTGNLELGGNQTGIDDEIVVNCGTLALGNAEYGIQLKAGLPVRVCAGAKLILPSSNAVAKSQIKIDGSGDAFGTVVLATDQTCASLAVRDVFESTDWTTLPAGTYGSSDSGAEFVRDDLFTGTGILRVGAAATPAGMMFLIY